MSSSQRTKLILHLSDLRIGDNTQVDERADAIISALTKSAPQKRFDFIAVTGDIKDQTADPTAAYEKAASFLTRLGSSLLRESDRARVLIVPGNHDWCKDSDFLFYNRFAQWWYGQSPIAHCLKSTDDDGKAPVAYLIDHRQDDVVFLLMNSYWKNTQAKDRLVSGEVCESQRQAFDRELESVFRNSTERQPKLALMHQHLIPTRAYPPDMHELIFSQDYPATVEWLSKHQTVIVFHGPPPGYALLRTDEVLSPQAKLREGTELMALGTGTCCGGEEDQFQTITVNLRPRRFLESTIEKSPYHWDGTTWVGSATPFTSHQTFSAFQTRLVEAEQFTSDQLLEKMPHPLRTGKASEWFWNHYNDEWDAFNRLGPLEIGELPLTRKEEFLKRLVFKLKEYNSKKAIFELLPFQLEAIYTYAAIFFGNGDIEAAAEREFNTSSWRSWLTFNDIFDNPRWSHLDWANWIIADELRAWIVRNSPECVGIVDLGYGLLRTIDAIGRNIGETPSQQRYLGIDVSSALMEAAKEMLAEKTTVSAFFDSSTTRKFREIGEWFINTPGRKFWRGNNPQLKGLSNDGFNVFVCVYAMHHSANSARVRKSLIDGSFFQYIKHTPTQGLAHLKQALGEQILHRVDHRLQDEFLNLLVVLSKQVLVRTSSGLEEVAVSHRSEIDKVLEWAFPNSQLKVYESVFKTMKQDGLLCIADPNGMSRTFNRQEIFRDPAIAVAHFSDWTDTVSMIHRVGFRKIRVFRQIRLNSLQVRRVEVPPKSIEVIINEINREPEPEIGRHARQQCFREPIMPEGFEQFRTELQLPGANVFDLEILDQHMGYIVIAEKIR